MRLRTRMKLNQSPKSIFVAGMLYMFIVLTVIAFLFHLFGLNWFASTVELPDVSPIIQEIVKGILKALELVFVYKMLTKKSFVLCACFAIIQTVAVGFIPMGLWQSLADAVCMFMLPIIFRKDRGWAIVDFLFIYLLMTIYALLLIIAKFGGISLDYNFSFYASVIAVLDYKLFVVTLYLYTKYKGGVKLWMKNRKLLTPTA